MLANLIQLIAPRDRGTAASYNLKFVREVRIRRRPPRNPRVERVLTWGWILIALKCWFVTWAVARYAIPVHPLWVNVPTIIFAALCSAVYHWRR